VTEHNADTFQWATVRDKTTINVLNMPNNHAWQWLLKIRMIRFEINPLLNSGLLAARAQLEYKKIGYQKICLKTDVMVYRSCVVLLFCKQIHGFSFRTLHNLA